MVAPIEREEIFEKYEMASYTVAGFKFAFPVVSIREDGGNRLVERERPYRDGAKLDDTGSKARRWTLEAIFENTINEDGMRAANEGRALYPDTVNYLIFAFDNLHETGDLVVPTIGVQRVRASSYSRLEAADVRDYARVSFTFVEDNEDSVGFRDLKFPSASANAQRLSTTSDFDMQSQGAYDETAQSLGQTLTELQVLANSPGEAAQDIEQQARRVIRMSQTVERTFSQPAKDGRELFKDPENSRGPRKLTQQKDMARRSIIESRKGRPQILTIVFSTDMTMFRISAVVEQDVQDLLDINADLNPFYIPKNTSVRVYATETLLNAGTASP